jgi:hypothetical protein
MILGDQNHISTDFETASRPETPMNIRSIGLYSGHGVANSRCDRAAACIGADGAAADE